jgi:hypothetical protein
VIIPSARRFAALIDAQNLEKVLEMAADSHDDCRPSARSDTQKRLSRKKKCNKIGDRVGGDMHFCKLRRSCPVLKW